MTNNICSEDCAGCHLCCSDEERDGYCGCGNHVGDVLHTCPYAEEINGNDSPCNCCESCTSNCANDI